MNGQLSNARYSLPLEAVHRDLNRWFDQFFSPSSGRFNGGEESWRAPAALWEDNDNFHLEVEVPGVTNDGIDVTFEKGVLQVKAERNAPEGDRKYWHHDRYYGTLQFQLRLPDTVDGENVQAELTHGVLHLTLAKRPEAQPKKITVKAAE